MKCGINIILRLLLWYFYYGNGKSNCGTVIVVKRVFSLANSLCRNNFISKKLCYKSLFYIEQTDRSQYVIYDGVKSETRLIKCGVPQGSILGSLLFIISMNDICNISDLMFAIMYVDDTCFFNKRHRSV